MPDIRSEDREVQQYRTPPYSKEAEDGVLGALLIDNNTFDLIGGKIDSEDFYDYGNRLIFENIKRLLSQGKPADILTVHDILREGGLEKETGGLEYLNRLADYSPGAANVLRYAEIIRDRSIRRRLITTGNDIINDSMNPGAREAKDLLDEAQAKVLRISEDLSRSSSGFQKIDAVLADYTDHLRELSEIDNPSNVSGTSTGFPDLDRMTSGMHDGQLIIIAGRPAMGKTALATNMAYNVAEYMSHDKNMDPKSKGVAFFSLEMSADQLASRILATVTQTNGHKMRTGELDNAEFTRIAAAVRELEKIPLYIDDTPGLNINTIRTRARRLKRNKGLGLIVIDYIQLIVGSGSKKNEGNRVQELSEISRGLKILAKELNVPVIALSQLNRGVEQRDDKRPVMSDLRESGSIEQDADIVMFVYRENYYIQNEEPKQKAGETPEHLQHRMEEWQQRVRATANIGEVIIGKQRHGPTGTVQLFWNGDFAQFGNLTKEEYLPEQVG